MSARLTNRVICTETFTARKRLRAKPHRWRSGEFLPRPPTNK